MAGFAGARDRARTCLCLRVCEKSQPPQRLRGPRCRGSEAYFRSWAVFDGGDLFSVGLYMVAPRLAEGGPALCGRSQQGDRDSSEGRERDKGEGF